jgi:hypothetical protein
MAFERAGVLRALVSASRGRVPGREEKASMEMKELWEGIIQEIIVLVIFLPLAALLMWLWGKLADDFSLPAPGWGWFYIATFFLYLIGKVFNLTTNLSLYEIEKAVR